MTETVAVSSCTSYNRDAVYQAVSNAIERTGTFPDVVGKRVLIKPNLLTHSKDCIERGVCTHPNVVYAVTRYVIERGGFPEIADSPGGKLSHARLKSVYLHCGIEKITTEFGLTLNYDPSYSNWDNPNGVSLKSFLIIDAVKDADIIISVCKLKTHVLTHYTGAIKNTFGVVPGLHKSMMHRRFQTISEFVNMLIDLNEIVKPNFVVMDAVVGMEGDGPNNGTPKEIGYILASSSIYAEDVAAQKLIGIDPLSVPTTAEAVKRGKVRITDVEIVGDEFTPLSDFRMPSYYRPQPDWIPNSKSGLRNYLHSIPRQYIGRSLRFFGLTHIYRPVISQSDCIGCGSCVRYCPAQAIGIQDNHAHVNLKKCIHCSGCEDACPKKAITRDTKPRGLGIIAQKFHRHIYAYPAVKPDNCIGCAQCSNICSVDAVKIVNRKAEFNTAKCIRCYCCHEMCSYDAIEIRQPAWKKFLRR
ncbi:MAG: DUF362 domain-containing protein [Methanocorpusculum sp.]|nr:DUF362 domain-containing protein [Oscillospiraceae bacterium]MBQ3570052.1 DUF362 domain-containing protein [Methanocorpusculum sp.]